MSMQSRWHGITQCAFGRTVDGDPLCETLNGPSTATGTEGDFSPRWRTRHFRHATGSNAYVGVWTNPAKTTGQVSFAARSTLISRVGGTEGSHRPVFMHPKAMGIAFVLVGRRRSRQAWWQ
jgi:hypothetical protein